MSLDQVYVALYRPRARKPFRAWAVDYWDSTGRAFDIWDGPPEWVEDRDGWLGVRCRVFGIRTAFTEFRCTLICPEPRPRDGFTLGWQYVRTEWNFDRVARARMLVFDVIERREVSR